MNKVKACIILILINSYGSSVIAQDLNLFQATESSNSENEETRQSQRTNSNSRIPAFTLIGTSRFGDEYFASLLNRDGNRVKVDWTKGIVKQVPGYLSYAIVQVNSRSVSLRFPEDEPCIENEDKGVVCNGDMAVLTLSTAAPIPPKQKRENIDNNLDDNNSTNGNSEIIFDEQIDSEFNQETIEGTNILVRNPFSGELQTAPQLTADEIAAREERRQRRAEQFRNFEIVRIPESDIPEGMQRIRTPFGDRLEPIEN